MRLPYGTLRRWRSRHRAHRQVRRKPGPAKTGPLPVADFRRRVARLVHGPKLTTGTGLLATAFAAAVPRRRIRRLVARLRARIQQRRRRAKHHVTWHHPNTAWAIDALKLRSPAGGPAVTVVLARDLASHFHFDPLVLPAESAAANIIWLQQLFARHGPPLFLKRDNGAPFNAAILDGFLADNCVLSLNSPVRRPAYNGGIEHGVGSFKKSFFAAIDPSLPLPPPHLLTPLLRSLNHLHNARPRRSLGGISPANSLFNNPAVAWSRRQRHAIFRWISARAESTLQDQWDTNGHLSHATAWRRAAVFWLRRQNLITVSQSPQPSPILNHQKRP